LFINRRSAHPDTPVGHRWLRLTLSATTGAVG
jgi:hypothetical protein